MMAGTLVDNMADKRHTPSSPDMSKILADLVDLLHVKPGPLNRHHISTIRESLSGQSFGQPTEEKKES
jgi:hypothetical protein